MISNWWFVRGVFFLRCFTGVGEIKIDKFFDFQTIGDFFFFTVVIIRLKDLSSAVIGKRGIGTKNRSFHSVFSGAESGDWHNSDPYTCRRTG
jgi:hypothetical protein